MKPKPIKITVPPELRDALREACMILRATIESDADRYTSSKLGDLLAILQQSVR